MVNTKNKNIQNKYYLNYKFTLTTCCGIAICTPILCGTRTETATQHTDIKIKQLHISYLVIYVRQPSIRHV